MIVPALLDFILNTILEAVQKDSVIHVLQTVINVTMILLISALDAILGICYSTMLELLKANVILFVPLELTKLLMDVRILIQAQILIAAYHVMFLAIQVVEIVMVLFFLTVNHVIQIILFMQV